MGRWRVLVWLAALGVSAAAGPDETARRLWSEYQQLRGDEGWKAFDRRLDILRGLGSCDCDRARDALLKLVRMSRSGDERLLAILSLGKIADLDAARTVLKTIERHPEPALSQAFADAFGATPDPEILAWLGGEALETKQPEALRACIEALGNDGAIDAAPRIVEIWKSSKDVDVLHEAVRTLGRVGGPGAREVILAAASNGDWRVRLAAAGALPGMSTGDEQALAAVRALLLDPAPCVRRAAIAAVGAAKLDASAPDLIELLAQDPRLRTREAAREALKKLSGRDYGHDAQAWREWLRVRAEAGNGEPERRITFAQYYGVPVASDRVLFLVDVSGSMSWPWRREPKRIDVARSELVRVIRELRPESLFNVILFSTRVRSWQKGEVPAEPKNVDAAIRWAERNLRDPEGDTYTYDALQEAFERNPEFDTIFLLSDGQPSHGPYASPEGILESVKVWNRYRGAVIHTVGLTLEDMDRGMPNLAEDLKLMKSFVERLAATTGGECKIIVRPP